jgi:NAD(P)-dependent dehydrogenase (short-subunit alcohol dehydrogenase family)
MIKYPNVVIVTGASSGLGEAVCKFLKPKAFVIGISRSKCKEGICDEEFNVDFEDLKEVKQVARQIMMMVNMNTNIGLVLSAGTLGEQGGICDSHLEDWEKTFRVNLLSNMMILKILLPQMHNVQYGRVVALAGGGAAYGYPLFSGYALSKVAIVREVENLAMELKNIIDNFSIVALAPGAMETPMLEKVRNAGAEIKTTVDIQEPVDFIDGFFGADELQAKELSGKFIHVRDNFYDILHVEDKDKFWQLRRIE